MDFKINTRNALALTDVWYGNELVDDTDKLESMVSVSVFRLAQKSFLVRTVLMLWLGRRYPLLLTCWDGSGRLLALICGLLGSRKLVILEFIDFDYENKSPVISKTYAFFIKYILAPASRRAILNTQVFTSWEKARVEAVYGLDSSRVRLFNWPLALGEIKPRAVDVSPASPMVFSSGRAACDWETLFGAFYLGNWPLTVVCTAQDLGRVNALNRNGKAVVLTDIPKDEHDEIFESATIYALCLKEKQKSSGQIRLASSIDAGVPVVASDVRGLDGYLVHGVTALAYPPGDAEALNDLITELMADEAKRRDLVKSARAFAAGNTREIYMNKISQMIADSAHERHMQ